VVRARALLQAPPEEVVDRRGERLPPWYRGTFHLNLPDAPDGYAVLLHRGDRLALETYAEGLQL
jgi:hypothetical protein